jgi:hypothetical protein
MISRSACGLRAGSAAPRGVRSPARVSWRRLSGPWRCSAPPGAGAAAGGRPCAVASSAALVGRTRWPSARAPPSSTVSPGGQALQHLGRVQRAQAQPHGACAWPGRRRSQHRGAGRRASGRSAPAAAPGRARGARFPPPPTASCPRAGRPAAPAAANFTRLHRAARPPRARWTARGPQSAGRQRRRPPRQAAWPGCSWSR